jgi:hypothetical protein
MILLEQFRHERTDPPDDGPDLLDGADFRLLDFIPRALLMACCRPRSAKSSSSSNRSTSDFELPTSGVDHRRFHAQPAETPSQLSKCLV